MVTIRTEMPSDIDAREDLLDRVWGASRFAENRRAAARRPRPAGRAFLRRRTRWRHRRHGAAVGRLRRPGRPALLLGPLAVDEASARRGIGGALMRRAMAAARRRKHGAVLLVGDAPYYCRFGFSGRKDRARCGCRARTSATGCSAASSTPGALDGARGLIGATGRLTPAPSLDALIAGLGRDAASARHAA